MGVCTCCGARFRGEEQVCARCASFGLGGTPDQREALVQTVGGDRVKCQFEATATIGKHLLTDVFFTQDALVFVPCARASDAGVIPSILVGIAWGPLAAGLAVLQNWRTRSRQSRAAHACAEHLRFLSLGLSLADRIRHHGALVVSRDDVLAVKQHFLGDIEIKHSRGITAVSSPDAAYLVQQFGKWHAGQECGSGNELLINRDLPHLRELMDRLRYSFSRVGLPEQKLARAADEAEYVEGFFEVFEGLKVREQIAVISAVRFLPGKWPAAMRGRLSPLARRVRITGWILLAVGLAGLMVLPRLVGVAVLLLFLVYCLPRRRYTRMLSILDSPPDAQSEKERLLLPDLWEFVDRVRHGSLCSDWPEDKLRAAAAKRQYVRAFFDLFEGFHVSEQVAAVRAARSLPEQWPTLMRKRLSRQALGVRITACIGCALLVGGSYGLTLPEPLFGLFPWVPGLGAFSGLAVLLYWLPRRKYTRLLSILDKPAEPQVGDAPK